MGAFSDLAASITKAAAALDEYVEASGQAPASFDREALADLPEHLEPSRSALVNAAQDIKRLALGSRGILSEILFGFADEISLRAIYTFEIAQHVPLTGGISTEALAKAVDLEPALVERVLRPAIANHIFAQVEASSASAGATESSKGQNGATGTASLVIRHTAASHLLATDPDARSAVGLMTNELSPVGGLAVEALKRWPGSGEQTETAWALREALWQSAGIGTAEKGAQADRDLLERVKSLSIGSNPVPLIPQQQSGTPALPLFACLAQHPERAKRFGAGMRFFAKGPGWDLDCLVRGYDWAALDHEGSILVDVGGGQGAVTRRLAAATKHMKFVVQDLKGTVEDGKRAMREDKELGQRVSFEEHDFFKEQPLRNADVYFFRWILHNWSDTHCIRILRALVPALKDGARVLIYEFVLPDKAAVKWSEKQPANLDMLMLAQFNSSERSSSQWGTLLQTADPRLQLKRIVTPQGSLMSVVEAIWEPK